MSDKSVREIKSAFVSALKKADVKRGGLLSLAAEGWQEELPDEKFWVFTHRDFPNAVVYWNPCWGRRCEVLTADE